MKLSQVRPFKSLKALGEVTLPNFTVLTGANGSGKSHLLEAIKEGAVTTDLDITSRDKQVGLYNFQNLVPNDVGRIGYQQVHQHRDFFVDQTNSRKQQIQNNILGVLRQHGVEAIFMHDPWLAVSLPIATLEAHGLDAGQAQELHRQLNDLENALESHLRQQTNNDAVRSSIIEELVNSGTQLSRLSDKDFDEKPFSFVNANIFQHSFGEMFFAYFEKYKANELRRLQRDKGRATSIPVLSDDEFVDYNGAPPWEFVNRILTRAKLDFEIDFPDDFEATSYTPKLTKKSSGASIRFNDLSSGERVLMSFAFCIYYSLDSRQKYEKPKLLLFDEVDASLHPSMSKTLVELINEILVKEQGVPTILVTHSPSTVAVAPEESIHLLESYENRLSKETKRRAVSTLTSEIPTMSIEFTGRRQVFVENDFDADRYAQLYQILAPFIDSERSLTFIGIASIPQAPTGSAQVIETVKRLANSGNVSTFGLVDWDLKTVGTNRIEVLGRNERYAIENFVLDPMVLLAGLLSEKPSAAQSFGLPSSITFLGLKDARVDQLQPVIDRLQTHLIPVLEATEVRRPKVVRYLGGLSLQVDEAYLTMNGHKLEEAVLSKLPPFRRFGGTGVLLARLIEAVMWNHPWIVPETLFESMSSLCARVVE